jgi:osmotically-inducible protein OsmY
VRADRAFGAFVAAAVIAAVSSCTSLRGIDSIGGYVDDSAITSAVKTRFAEDKTIDAGEIVVETANGNVVLSGVARSSVEKGTAESLAIKVRGVKSLQNNIVVKP